MGNFFISYDLNGKTPTHAEMDRHLNGLFGAKVHRVLESVWFVRTGLSKFELYNYINGKTSLNDRLLVIDANDAVMRNLLVPNSTVQTAWEMPRALPTAPRPPLTAPVGLGLGRR